MGNSRTRAGCVGCGIEESVLESDNDLDTVSEAWEGTQSETGEFGRPENMVTSSGNRFLSQADHKAAS